MGTKKVEKSILTWHSAQQMYDLVCDIPRYPEFLPWCSKTSIVQQHSDGVSAEVQMSIKGFSHRFRTRNIEVPHSRITMQLEEGPFSSLHGVWQFSDMAQVGGQACRIQFSLEYSFSNMALAMLIGPVFDKITNQLVDAFIQRAQTIYGDQ